MPPRFPRAISNRSGFSARRRTGRVRGRSEPCTRRWTFGSCASSALPCSPNWGWAPSLRAAKLFVDAQIVHEVGASEAELKEVIARKTAEVEERSRRFRRGRAAPDLADKTFAVSCPLHGDLLGAAGVPGLEAVLVAPGGRGPSQMAALHAGAREPSHATFAPPGSPLANAVDHRSSEAKLGPGAERHAARFVVRSRRVQEAFSAKGTQIVQGDHAPAADMPKQDGRARLDETEARVKPLENHRVVGRRALAQ